MRILLIVFVLFVSCEKKSHAPIQEIPVEVSVYQVEPQKLVLNYSYKGVVQSSHEVQILSAVQGELQRIAFTEGSFVRQGDLLFQIDDRRYRARVKEAQADLDAQQAVLTTANQSLKRLKPLLQEEAVSQKDIDEAQSQVLTAQANFSKAKAALDLAKLDLDDTSITSPISGYISSAQFQEGSLIIPNCTRTLATVSVVDPIFVELSSSEGAYLRMMNQIKSGELATPKDFDFEVDLILSDGSKYPLPGKMTFVSPVFKAETGTLISRAIFPNPDNFLKPGLFVEAIVKGLYQPNAIVVPQEAVQQGIQGIFVYVVDAERRAEVRPISLENIHEEYWIVKSGLKKGDQVVISGMQKIKNGTLVRVKKNVLSR